MTEEWRGKHLLPEYMPAPQCPTCGERFVCPTAAQSRIAELERERDEARSIVAAVNNEVIGSDGYFTSPSCVEAVREVKRYSGQRLKELTAARARIEALEKALSEALKTIRFAHRLQPGAADPESSLGQWERLLAAKSESASQPPLIQHAFVACYHGVGLCVTNPGPDGCHHGEPYCGQPRSRHIQGQQSEREG